MAIGYGASFPGIYDWTWGEATVFVQAHVDHDKQVLRHRAMMDMTAIGVIGKMMSGCAGNQTIMDLYTFLWTKEERQQAKIDNLRARMEAQVRADMEGGE